MGKRPTPGKGRSTARLAAVQALYQIELSEAEADQVIAEFTGHRLGESIEGEKLAKPDAVLFAELVRGVVLNRRDLDDMIAAVLTMLASAQV